MYRSANPWISNYLSHVKFCGQELGSETPIKLGKARLLQKRALSFQKVFLFEEKNTLAKNTKDIDVNLLASLPKVSELRKRFEGISPSTSCDWEMNRKERIARRLEGIESEVHPAILPSCPGLVTNQLVEEDTPRYTRASDTCVVTVQRYSKEDMESPEMMTHQLVTAPERQSRARCRPEEQTQTVLTEPTDPAGSDLDSKVERIARYKAERRRQLAERYGISLDQEPDTTVTDHFSSRYGASCGLKELASSSERQQGYTHPETRCRAESVGDEHSYTSSRSRVGRVAPPPQGYGKPDQGRPRVDSFTERERVENLENQRRAAQQERNINLENQRRAAQQERNIKAPEPQPPSSSTYMDVTSSTSAKVPIAKHNTIMGLPPSSPKTGRKSLLPSPKQGEGDLFIEQQAHNILSRQGIRIRDKLAREEGVRKRSPELGHHVPEAPLYRRHPQITTRSTAYHHDPQAPAYTTTDSPGPKSYSHHQPQLTRSGRSDDPSYLSMTTGPGSGAQRPQQPLPEEEKEMEGEVEEEEKRGAPREGRKAVLPSEIRGVQGVGQGREAEPRGGYMERGGERPRMRWEELDTDPEPIRPTEQPMTRLQAAEVRAELRASREKGQQPWSDNAIYIQRGVSPISTHIQNRGGGPTATTMTTDAFISSIRSSSDTGPHGAPRGSIPRAHEPWSFKEAAGLRRGAIEDGIRNRDQRPLETRDARISVAKLRHSYLESATTATAPVVRKPELSGLSPVLPSTEADEEKLDERAKLSVAAKRSLFRELERNTDGGSPKPPSRNVAMERRLRRTQDRSHTQPVTTEEVVIAATLHASSQESAAAREQARQTHNAPEVQREAQRTSSKLLQTSSPEENQPQTQYHQGQGDAEPDLSTLSLAEKMALFNRLAQPATRVIRTRPDSRGRRANARYQTQPITLGDLEQIHNGAKLGQLFSSALRPGATDHAGDIHLATGGGGSPAEAPNPGYCERYIPHHPSPPTQITEPSNAVWRSVPGPHHQASLDLQANQTDSTTILPQGEEGDLWGGKRKLPSPEGGVRKAPMPQAWSGEREWEEDQRLARLGGGEGVEPQRVLKGTETGGGGLHQDHRQHQEQRGYLRQSSLDLQDPDGHRSKVISTELPDSSVSSSRAAEQLRSASLSPHTLLPQARELGGADTHTDGSSGLGHTHSLVQSEQEDIELSEAMSARQMSIKDRLALLKKSGEEDWRNRINRKQDVVKVAVSERHGQLWEVEQSFKKKRMGGGEETTENQNQPIEMSIHERKQLIVAREEAWKSKGHGAANDSTQFTVAARMVKKGLASPSALLNPVTSLPSKPKNTTPAISKPLEEIEAKPDMILESDRKLDKLDSFLSKLNSKVGGLQESTITVTKKTVKDVMNLDDEMFDKFYRHMAEMPLNMNSKVDINDDFDDIFGGTQMPKLTSAMVEHKRSVRPVRNVQSSRNPLKMLAAREDIRPEYTEQRLNIGLLESKRMKQEKMNKNSGFSEVALAGLASKENFSSVNLRRVNISDQMSNNSAVPYKKLMLLQVKGHQAAHYGAHLSPSLRATAHYDTHLDSITSLIT